MALVSLRRKDGRIIIKTSIECGDELPEVIVWRRKAFYWQSGTDYREVRLYVVKEERR